MDSTTKQLDNIEKATGNTVADFAESLAGQCLEKHGQLVKFLKLEPRAFQWLNDQRERYGLGRLK